jgi:glycosyltransferase involved in cell wall biosynthesis
MKMSAGVIAGNQYILNYAQNAGAKNILKLPTVIDLDKYASIPPIYKKNKNFTIGWIGSPSTTKYLEIIKEPLAELGLKIPILLYLVGADINYDISIDNIEIVSIPWSEQNEQEALKVFDVGIMPLYDNPWEKGKCAFKLIQYMASFLPVVASDVGMNSEIINNYNNGFVAKNSGDWFNFFYMVYSRPKLRVEMGLKGRDIVEKNFTIQSKLSEFENFVSN